MRILHGPSTARVEGLDTRWRSYTGEFSEFRIVPEWNSETWLARPALQMT